MGAVAESVALVTAGGFTLPVSLQLLFAAVRRPRGQRRPLVAYRLLVALMAVSIPVGVTMSFLGHG